MKLKYALVSAVMVFAAACSTSPSASPSSTDSTTSSTPSETCAWFSPITGLCANETDPVLVVKIDDVKEARPQYSLNEADMIVVEPVEGGLTRLFSVYQSQQPLLVGPVRSARITDPDIAEAFGTPGFVYSGSYYKVLPILKAASIDLIGAPQGGKGYSREDGRSAPHNLIGTFADLLTRLKDPVASQMNTTSSFNFSTTPTAGKDIVSVEVKYPASKKTFTWNKALNAWTIKAYKDQTLSINAADGSKSPATATTIFVMKTILLPNPTKADTPYPKTFGEGGGYIFANGQVLEVTWKRPTVKDLPHWYLASGEEVSIPAGRMWWCITSDREKVTVNYPASASPSESAS